jgi:hypothetical protein
MFEGLSIPKDVSMSEKLSDMTKGKVQTTVDGSQASNKETNNKQFEAIEQHA